ncbi:MAG: hypothetical protein J6Y49_01365 [Alphaproteobacteria bacterium]|nr:hypothetical protein [Alphaproteobacteria bacterium]
MTNDMKIKLTYVAPLTETFDVRLDKSVVASSYHAPDVYSIDLDKEPNFFASSHHNVYSAQQDKEERKICPETRCPFNFKWCRDKQRVLDEWRNAIEYHAKKRLSNVIYTSADMFDGCPHNYMTLCSLHEQRQH